MSNLRAAIIGLGTHANRGHLDHFKEAGIDIVAASDPNLEVLEQFNNDHGIPIYLTTKAMLEDPNVEAVFIMSPDRFHANQTLDAVRAGKHVFCEKPMADSYDGLDTLKKSLDIAAQNGLVVTSCHPRRFDPPFQWLQSELPGLEAKFGKRLEFRFDFSYAKAPAAKAGLHHGLLIDHFSHEVDTMGLLFGAVPFKAHVLYDTEDRYHVAGIRKDELVFSFNGSRMLNAPIYPETCSVRFERGEIMLDLHAGTAVIHDHDAESSKIVGCGATDYSRRFTTTNAEFVKAVRGEPNSCPTPQDVWLNTEASILMTFDRRTYESAGYSDKPLAEWAGVRRGVRMDSSPK